MEQSSEDCKTCHSYNTEIYCTLRDHPELAKKCVCQQCILKSMCQNACRPYFDLLFDSDLLTQQAYDRELEALKELRKVAQTNENPRRNE